MTRRQPGADAHFLPTAVDAFRRSLDPLRREAFDSALASAKGSDAFMDYVQAFIRLLDNAPSNDAELCARAQEERIKVTIENVAREAGRKRGRISGPKSDFPALGAFIKSYRSSHGVNESTVEKLVQASRDKARLEHRVTVLQSRVAEAIIIAERLELENADLRGQIKRLKSMTSRR